MHACWECTHLFHAVVLMLSGWGVTFMSRLTCSSTCAALDHRSLMLAPSIRFNLVAVGREFVVVRQRVTDGVAIVSRGCFVSGQCGPMPAQPGTVHDLAFTSKCLSSRDDHLDPTMRFVYFVSVMHNRNHWHLGLHATVSIRLGSSHL